MSRFLSAAFSISLISGFAVAMAQTPPATAEAQAVPARGARPPSPTRDPHTPGYVTAKELPDGEVPSPKVDGNFIIGPTHNPAPEMAVQEIVPQGMVSTFTMQSTDSKYYPGIARDGNPGARGGPGNGPPAVITSHP